MPDELIAKILKDQIITYDSFLKRNEIDSNLFCHCLKQIRAINLVKSSRIYQKRTLHIFHDPTGTEREFD